MIENTKVYWRLVDAWITHNYKIYGLQGGTSSSKTYSILQFLIYLASNDKTPKLTSVVSETIPHLKRGVIRDFFKIMDTDERDARYNQTNMIFTFANGSQIEFFSADDPSKLRGARRDRLYINECNNISKSAFDQLEPRTKREVFLDWNPECKFWFHEKLQGQDNVFFDISTYKDNIFLDQNIVDSIESREFTDPEWWRVYGQGQIGQYEGTIFKRVEVKDLAEAFKITDEIYYGIDFGYDPDPFAFVVVGFHNDTIYIFKEIVSNNLLSDDIAKLIKPWCGREVVWCDSEDPKSIAELKELGINAKSVGEKDRQTSINWIKNHKIEIDEDCINAKDEFQNYHRLKDKDGNYMPIFPKNQKDHTISAVRYALKLKIVSRANIKTAHIRGI